MTSAKQAIANNLPFYGDMTTADLERQVDVILAALDAAGFAIVPKEPTHAMCYAATSVAPTWDDDVSRAKYKAMLIAAKETT